MFHLRSEAPTEVQPGDIIGFSGECLTSDLINIATYGIPRWGISHVGIMGEATDGRFLLWESTTLDGLPCEITGKPFFGTQAHSAGSSRQSLPRQGLALPLVSVALRQRAAATHPIPDGDGPYALRRDGRVPVRPAWASPGSSRCFTNRTCPESSVRNGAARLTRRSASSRRIT